MAITARHAADSQPLTEAQFQRQRVIDTAKLHGWLVWHARSAWTTRGYRTPIVGDKGAPDLLLARAGTVLLVELKTDNGRTTPAQRHWLHALGPYARLWRPRDWPHILTELKEP